MPEGDTIFRAARTLHRALGGQTVTRFEAALAPVATIAREHPLIGTTVEHVASAGKHLLMTFSNGYVLRTHMRMNGSWHIYRPGERWRLPRYTMRLLIETADWVAVAFNVYSAELIAAAAAGAQPQLRTLGPDLLGDFDAAEAVARIKASGARPMHEVLLDQRIVAGLGNVYKSEILFLSRVHPDTPASGLTDEQHREWIALAQRLLRSNVADGAGPGIVTYRGPRRTTARMNPEDRLWVYSRGGRPCRTCGTRLASRKDGDDARVTYWCPACQPRTG